MEQQDIEIDQILYCSLARYPMEAVQLQSLADNAAHMNRMDHITGLLMYADSVFVQMIEGPPGELEALWRRLLKDKRHFGVVQIYHLRYVEARACPSWGMRHVTMDVLRAIIHEAKIELALGRTTPWATAIERMDFLLANSNWDAFVEDLRKSNKHLEIDPRQ